LVLIVLGILIGVTGLAWLGVVLFALSTVFALLPCRSSSTRAGERVSHCVQPDWSTATRMTRSVRCCAAAWTYVAGFAASLLTLLCYVFRVSGMRRRRIAEAAAPTKLIRRQRRHRWMRRATRFGRTV
jgi:uncharacterized protein